MIGRFGLEIGDEPFIQKKEEMLGGKNISPAQKNSCLRC
jgi:hypothetical protein